MDLVEQDFDIKFVKDINDIILKINENISQFFNYFSKLEILKYEEEFLNVVNNFNQIIKATNKFSKEEYLKIRQANFEEDLKIKFKNYSENISKLYENDYIKRMKEYNQDLEYLINNFNCESEVKNLSNSNSGNNISTNNESFGEDKRSLSPIFYDNCASNEDNNKINNNDDINFNCSVCSIKNPNKATIFCDKCNQLFCDSCYKVIEKLDKNGKCDHNIQNISKMKVQNEIGKIFYLNSLNNFIKRTILKSNYLLNNQNQQIKFINNGDSNSLIINFIKKSLFEYPIIKDINDITEINYLKSINTLINNLDINNIDINSYNISELHEDLVSSLKNVFMNEKNEKINSGLGIRDLVNQKEDIDDYDESGDENDITDEKNIIKPIKKNESK